MLQQAACRHQSSGVSFHVFLSCSFSNLCLFFILCMVSQAAKTLALSPPPFVLQWERECTADALLSAARPASEQCIGLMQCSCVLTHSTSPPPVCLLHPSPPSSAATISFPCSHPRLVPHVLRPSPPSFTFMLALLVSLFFTSSITSSPSCN